MRVLLAPLCLVFVLGGCALPTNSPAPSPTSSAAAFPVEVPAGASKDTARHALDMLRRAGCPGPEQAHLDPSLKEFQGQGVTLIARCDGDFPDDGLLFAVSQDAKADLVPFVEQHLVKLSGVGRNNTVFVGPGFVAYRDPEMQNDEMPFDSWSVSAADAVTLRERLGGKRYTVNVAVTQEDSK